MNSNARHSTIVSKIRRLQKRKRRTHSVHVHEENIKRKIASLGVLMQFFVTTGGKGLSMLVHLMREESLDDPTLQLEQSPKDVHYNTGIRNLGQNNFLSAAATFCHDIAHEGRMIIVSVGSGDGTIEKKINEAYRERYGEHSSNLNIILVDPDPRYRVHFKYVDELIDKRPDVVGHCALFIFWPDPQPKNEGYDIEAIRKLQPHGVLTVYESGGASGSPEFVNFLHGGNAVLKLPWTELGIWNHQNVAFDITEECESHGLDNYEVYQVAVRKVFRGPFLGTVVYRIAIARRMDFDFFNVCPAINWTCKREELEFRKFVAENRNLKPNEEKLLNPGIMKSQNAMLFNMRLIK